MTKVEIDSNVLYDLCYWNSEYGIDCETCDKEKRCPNRGGKK